MFDRKARVSTLLLVTTVACIQQRPGPGVVGDVADIEAKRGEVLISLPAPGGPGWAWNRPTSPAGDTEYLWTVWLYPEDAAPFGVAVYVRRSASEPPARGSLARLLEQAVVDRWDAIERNGAAAHRLSDVTLKAARDRAVLVIRDTAFVRHLFATRPDTAKVSFSDYTGDGREAPDEWPGVRYPRR